MVWEPVGKQRVRADSPGGGSAGWNSHCLLPDRPRVGHFENARSGIKKFAQVHEINMGPHMIGAEIVHRIERSEINLPRDSLSGLDFQRRLCIVTAERRYRLTLISRYLEPKP